MGLWSDPSTKGRDEAGKSLSDKRNPLPLGRGGCQVPKIEDILADDWVIEEDKEEEE